MPKKRNDNPLSGLASDSRSLRVECFNTRCNLHHMVMDLCPYIRHGHIQLRLRRLSYLEYPLLVFNG